jgi:hypothetical protein
VNYHKNCMKCVKSLCGQSSLVIESVHQMLDVMGFSKYIYQSKTCISVGDVMSAGLKCWA